MKVLQIKSEMTLLLLLLTGTVLIMVIGPFTVHEHYIYGLFALLLVILVRMPPVFATVLVLGFSLFWIMNMRFDKAAVPTAERLACVETVCSTYPQPIYVVTNSGSHDHQGLGYAFLAQRMECNMFAVTQWKDHEPKTMVVMNENTQYDFSGTDFYELNRFGERKFVEEVGCGETLSATVFQK
jgi:hypothetical protein